MAKEKDKTSGASAAAPAKDAPAPAAPAIPAEAPKRSRFSFSKDQKLAFVLSGLIGILGTEAIAKLLTDEQKAKVTKAQAEVEKIGVGDPFKAVNDRIAAIQVELKAIDYAADLNKAVAQAKELSAELDRQIKRKAQITEMIGA